MRFALQAVMFGFVNRGLMDMDTCQPETPLMANEQIIGELSSKIKRVLS